MKHCSAGIGRTGAILIIDMILDKIKILGIQCDLDIYKAVCHLRSQRSGMIQTEKQYQFSHQAIHQFIENYEKSLHSRKNNNNNTNLIDDSVDHTKGFVTSTPRTSSLSSVYSSSVLDKKSYWNKWNFKVIFYIFLKYLINLVYFYFFEMIQLNMHVKFLFS